ncbi:DUF6101 family protein [Roseiarcus fermentans]|uniref:DUF6101 family protein n=1 Tax=Roseiarcus fermentans TaxID=1473586 RepID=UPI0011BEE3F5|nr:DUF6101 family protein [Roseiarcus fermentans]
MSIETRDPRSDDRRRIVEVGREAVTIRRAVAGVSMTIRLSCRAYRGVALRIGALECGRFHYEVKLTHSDPDLSIVLGAGDDLAAMEAQWLEWVDCLGLPALAGRSEASEARVNVPRVALACRTPHPRRRGAALTSRRPRLRKRRANGRRLKTDVVDDDPIILSPGWEDR